MALIKCPDCESPVSDMAPNCPKCNRPIKKGARSWIDLYWESDRELQRKHEIAKAEKKKAKEEKFEELRKRGIEPYWTWFKVSMAIASFVGLLYLIGKVAFSGPGVADMPRGPDFNVNVLRGRGYSEREIYSMTPEERETAIRRKKRPDWMDD